MYFVTTSISCPLFMPFKQKVNAFDFLDLFKTVISTRLHTVEYITAIWLQLHKDKYREIMIAEVQWHTTHYETEAIQLTVYTLALTFPILFHQQ